MKDDVRARVTRSMPSRAWIDLVRAPAALTVLGDTVAGATAAGRPLRGRQLLLPCASVAFYWAGMALNDWADRDLDAVERPERPIPSGRISPAAALSAAAALTGAGLGLAAMGGGRRTLPTAVLLAGSVWLYDTTAKDTPAGPIAMSLCRGLDVLLGAGDRPQAALPAAAALAGHTLGITLLSRGEVHGGSRAVGSAALAGTLAIAAGVATSGGRPRTAPGSRRHGLAATASAAVYAATVAVAQAAAVRTPSAPTVRRATIAGIHGMVPLQASLTARYGSLPGAATVGLLQPLARYLSRRVSPT